jgi:putative peptide zinc metalloprotease protein
MPEPAKLELLTRTPGEQGFQVHEVESSQAHVLFKPKRLAQSEWELTAQPRSPDGSRNYILRCFRLDRYLLLSPAEKFLWEHFDGSHSLSEIGRAFHFEFGAFDYAMIRQFLARLYHAGLLEEIEAASAFQRSHRDTPRRRWTWAVNLFLKKLASRLSFKLVRADRYCTLIYKRGGFLLFHQVTFWASLILTALAILAVVRLAPQAGEISLRLVDRPLLFAAIIISLIPVVSALHVLVHALACKSYGRRVREMGFFLLQGVLPTFYADVTDIFMSSRRARVIVDSAGPMVEVVLGSLAFLCAHWSAPGVEQSIFFWAGVLLWEGAIINLYPFTFLEMDGYNILADLLAMPTLRGQALSLFPSLPRRFRAAEKLRRSEWIQVMYLVLCLVSVLVYVATHLDVIGIEIFNWRIAL